MRSTVALWLKIFFFHDQDTTPDIPTLTIRCDTKVNRQDRSNASMRHALQYIIEGYNDRKYTVK